MSIEKYSKQRDAIIQELCSRTDHPTADEIYMSLRNVLPSISLGTVYRNLSKLSDDGKILKLSCDGADHFDGNIKQHYHLFCNVCHRVYDIDVPVFKDLDLIADKEYGGKVFSHNIMFYGICTKCNKGYKND